MKSILSFLVFLQAHAISYDYWMPERTNDETRVFLALHGCKQEPEDLIRDTFLEEKVESDNIVIFAPDQQTWINFDRCWNWFFRHNQFSSTFSTTESIRNSFHLFKLQNNLLQNRTYGLGFSAGSGQLANLFACYPDEFDGVAFHSGIAYRSATGVEEAEAILTDGPSVSNEWLAENFNSCNDDQEMNLWGMKDILLFHGSDDERVVSDNFEAFEAQLLGHYDLLDDDEINNSALLNQYEEIYYPQEKYPYQIDIFEIEDNVMIQSIFVEGLGHDWSGGEERVGRNDPNGPQATEIILETFL